MKKTLILLTFCTMPYITHGASQTYIPSTSTFQGNSSVINIASGTIRNLNASTFTVTNFVVTNATATNLNISTLAVSNVRISSGSASFANLSSTGVVVGTMTATSVTISSAAIGNPFNMGGNLFSRLSILTVGRNVFAGTAHGITEGSNFNGDVGSAYASIESIATISGSNNHDHLAGFQAAESLEGSGTMVNQWDFLGNGGVNGGGLTNKYNLYAANAGGTGTITNQYGLYIESLTRGSSSNYGIYEAGNNANLLSGPTQIGGSTVTVPTGFMGNVVSSFTALLQNCPASGIEGTGLTITTGPGNWLLSGGVDYNRNGSTFTASNLLIALSSSPGTSFTGEVSGFNTWQVQKGTDTTSVTWTHQSITGSSYYVQNGTGTYNYYLKVFAATYTSGTPQFSGNILAIRQP